MCRHAACCPSGSSGRSRSSLRSSTAPSAGCLHRSPQPWLSAHVVTRSSRQAGEPGCMPACLCRAFSSKSRNQADATGRHADLSSFRRSQRLQPRLKETHCRPGLWSGSGGRRPAEWPRRRRSRCRCSAPPPGGPRATGPTFRCTTLVVMASSTAAVRTATSCSVPATQPHLLTD